MNLEHVEKRWNLEALIFDFDGLILDTEWEAYKAWQEIYHRYGCELKLDQWVRCVGAGYHLFDPVKELMDLTGLSLDGTALRAEKDARKAKASRSLKIMDGVHDRIAEARQLGFKIGLATSSFRQVVHEHLIRLDLERFFDAYVTGDEVSQIKPHPDLYLACAARLKVDPQNCLVFEDSLNGVRAAKAAQMYCIAIPNRVTRFQDFAPADSVKASLSEVNLKSLAKPKV